MTVADADLNWTEGGRSGPSYTLSHCLHDNCADCTFALQCISNASKQRSTCPTFLFLFLQKGQSFCMKINTWRTPRDNTKVHVDATFRKDLPGCLLLFIIDSYDQRKKDGQTKRRDYFVFYA
jgi:hypothetical protein